MRCRKGKLCEHFVLSTSVTVEGTSLIVNVPNLPCYRGCLTIAQAIPAAATVNMPVFVTVGTNTTQYPLLDRRGIQLSAGRIDSRDRYPYRFINANTTSVIKICGARCPYNSIQSVPVV